MPAKEATTTNEYTSIELEAETSTVRIAHSSTSKFFRNEASSQIKQKEILIGASKGQSHLKLAKICLQAICNMNQDPVSWRSLGVGDKLLSYAAQNFPHHLSEGRSVATMEDRVEIFSYLYRTFQDESLIERWVPRADLWLQWYDTKGALGVVHSWLMDEDVMISKDDAGLLGNAEKHWILQSHSSSIEKTLRQVALWIAKKWLVDTEDCTMNQCAAYRIYLTLFIQLVSDLSI